MRVDQNLDSVGLSSSNRMKVLLAQAFVVRTRKYFLELSDVTTRLERIL